MVRDCADATDMDGGHCLYDVSFFGQSGFTRSICCGPGELWSDAVGGLAGHCPAASAPIWFADRPRRAAQLPASAPWRGHLGGSSPPDNAGECDFFRRSIAIQHLLFAVLAFCVGGAGSDCAANQRRGVFLSRLLAASQRTLDAKLAGFERCQRRAIHPSPSG